MDVIVGDVFNRREALTCRLCYIPRDDDRGGLQVIRDTESLEASYERYLRSAKVPSYGVGQSTNNIDGGISSQFGDDSHVASIGGVSTQFVGDSHVASIGGIDPGEAIKDENHRLSSGRAERTHPPDATSTLFVRGLPSNCSRREVAHIFHPFVGYKEVRLPGGDPLVLCFVDFVSPAHSATAMDALQGYKFDELDHNSANLRFQFFRNPGARPSGGQRGQR